MKSKLAIAVSLSGWIFSGVYFFVEYILLKNYTVSHFFYPEDRSHLILHLIIFFAPLVSSSMGYLVNQRISLLKGLKASDEKYRDLYENAPDGYCSIAPDGAILEANETIFRVFGYERDKVIGKVKVTEFLTDEGIKTFEKIFSILKEKGYVENVELDIRKKNGDFLPVIVNATAIYDKDGNFLKGRSIVRDNTLKKRYEQILRNASDEWRATFDSMPYGVILLDSEYNIVKTNEYISDILGIPIKELIFKKCYDVIHAQGRPIDGCPLEKSIKSTKTEIFEYYDTALGKYFMMSVSPIFDEDGFAIAYVHSLIDITDIKDKEKKLFESRNAFLNMLKDATSTYRELKSLYHGLILAFANALDAKSKWTRGHSERVAEYALSIAKKMGLKEKNLEDLRIACLLHDIGKIGTYDGILDKPGKLTDEEFELVKKHPIKGEEILKPIKELEHVLGIIRSHHERFDGRGYVDGLRGEEIPFLARILCVADSFDSMTADRPYRPSPGKEYAITELKRCSGTQFDPQVVEAFLKVL